MEQMMNHIRLTLVGLIISFSAISAFAGQKTASINIAVVGEADGKPVKNAEVVLHPVDPRGRLQDAGEELKTHGDGTVEVHGIPYGKYRIQVIAQGLKTFGHDYEVDQPSLNITIKLQQPSEHYSIYR